MGSGAFSSPAAGPWEIEERRSDGLDANNRVVWWTRREVRLYDAPSMPLFLRSSAHQDQYVSDLRAAYLGLRLFGPDQAFAQDPAVWDKMLRDPVIRHAVQSRCYSIAGRKWQMQPASDAEPDKAVAGILEELLTKIRGFTARARPAT